jgi:RNA 2',3'-cyclic 3'-phosphodiesterase
MRLFTALDLSEEVVGNLERLLDRLRPAARIKWSTPENLHITTKFIGEWPEAQLEEVLAALHGIPPRAPVEMRIAQLGYFPNPHSPRVFWAGIYAPGLAELARETEEALAAIGIPREKRAFSPHLTLARIKEPVPMGGLLAAVSDLPSLEFGSCVADRFYLYQSRLRPSGSIYTRVAEFPFAQ